MWNCHYEYITSIQIFLFIYLLHKGRGLCSQWVLNPSPPQWGEPDMPIDLEVVGYKHITLSLFMGPLLGILDQNTNLQRLKCIASFLVYFFVQDYK